MNKAFALAVLMTAATMGTAAYARDMGMATTPSSDVAIVYTNPEADDSARILDVPDIFIHPSRSMTQAAQNEIRTDSGLHQALVSQNVELNNVVAIQTAADGSKTVYVR